MSAWTALQEKLQFQDLQPAKNARPAWDYLEIDAQLVSLDQFPSMDSVLSVPMAKLVIPEK